MDTHDMLLGEMRGQLRELVHSVNNLNAKVDGLTREVVALGPLGAAVADLSNRVDNLEKAKSEQSGVVATVKAITNSPFVAWIIVLVGLVWAAITGRIQL